MHQYISAAIDQGGGCVSFFGWVEPLIDPHHFGFYFRVDRLRTEGEAVDVANHFRNRNRADHAHRTGLAHLACNHASHVGTLIGAAVVSAHVVCGLVTCGVLKLDVFVVCRHLEHWLHVAECGAENHLVALTYHVTNDAFGIG